MSNLVRNLEDRFSKLYKTTCLFCRTGDITELGVHAIVHSTNERLSEKSIVTEKIYSKAGPKLVEEIRNNIKSKCSCELILVMRKPGPTQTGLYNHRRWLEA